MNSFVTVIASFIIALLSGLGVGSGGLLVIWLTLIEGLPQTEARSLNLLFFLFSAGGALLMHLRRRELKLPLIALMSCVGMVGTLLGTYLGIVIDAHIVRKIFGGMLVLTGIYTFLSGILKRGGIKRKIPAQNAAVQSKSSAFRSVK